MRKESFIRRSISNVMTIFVCLVGWIGVSTHREIRIFVPSAFASELCSSKSIQQAPTLDKAEKIALKCSGNAAVQHALGIRLARFGRQREALKWLDRAIRLAPSNMRYKADKIVVLSWMGKDREALAAYKRLPKTARKPAYLLRNVARSAYNLNDFKLSLDLYSQALSQNPRNGEALKGVVFSLIRLKRFDEATRLVKQSEKKTFHPPVQFEFLRYDILLEKGNFKKAYNIWKTMGKRGKKTREWFAFWRRMIQPVSSETKKKIKAYFYANPSIPLRDRFLVTALSGDYKKALTLVDGMTGKDLQKWPVSYQNWVGWCYFKVKKFHKALEFYKKILRNHPDNRYARICISFCYSALKVFRKAKTAIDSILKQNPNDIDALFALAYMKEQQGLFLNAVLVYEKILRLKPANRNAQKLRLRALSDLGLPSLSLEEARKLRLNSRFITSLKLDEAAYFLKWGLKKEPLSIEHTFVSEQPKNLRARFDYILALRQDEDYAKAVKEYENLLKEKIRVPYWVKEAAADAYLYLEKPKKARKLYREVLKIRPKSYNAKMGLFYTLEELHDWDEAWKLLNAVDKETPPGRRIGRSFYPSWKKEAVMNEKAWLLMEEDRLQEAQDYLERIQAIMPAYMGTRTALGHVYLWRGWPRRALETFSIATTRNPKETQSWIGKAYALFNLGYEEEANHLRDKLLNKHPKNKHVITLDKYLRVQEAPRVLLDYNYDHEDTDSTDITFREEFSLEPILGWRTYQYFLWRRSKEKSRVNFYRRIGAGWRHRFNPTWGWDEAFSADTNGHSDFGIFSSLIYTPNDYWKITGLYDTSTPNIPMKARPYGITGDEASLRLEYNESEWRGYYLNLDTMFFSDRNERYAGLVGYNQGLFVRKGWLSRLNLELEASHNTKRNVPYFNPRNDFTVSVTPMLQKTHYQRYGRQFVHRIYATAGAYHQDNYGTKFIGSIRYEQDLKFSLNSALLWGVLYGQRVYDGDTVHAVNFYVRFEYDFGGY